MGSALRPWRSQTHGANMPRRLRSWLDTRQEDVDSDDDDNDGDLEDDIIDVFPGLPVRLQSSTLDNGQQVSETTTVQSGSSATTSVSPLTTTSTTTVGATSSTRTSSTTTPFVTSAPPDDDEEDDAQQQDETSSSTAEPTPAESGQSEPAEAPALPRGSSELGAAIGILIGSIVALVLILFGIRRLSRRRRTKRKRPPLVPPSSGHDTRGPSGLHSLSSPHPGRKATLPPSLATSAHVSTDWSAFDIEKAKRLDSSSSSDVSSIRTSSARGVQDRRVSALEKLEGPSTGADGSKRDSFWPRKYGINMNFDAVSPTMQRHPMPDNRNTTATVATTASSGILPIGMRV